ncbi:UvrD-helicase domain-containing protein [Collimonas humicola]|uniref:UvrD-helicase domain-containing protein n=1 Tax=Collimonas humicola TaxID=2825886 RepID=UPI001B8D438F|nr:UvrD-helicase domain-containing protein [Collimonas humicola]
MSAHINVSDDDIAYAERILLPAGTTFDDERRKFIRNLETIDLQAVPGSGKTTALLAKLLIIDRYLPFDDGSGVLVISHTNAAIDEIKNNIGLYCNNLFKYPNFVGTIQSFTNEFLATPFYVDKYKKVPLRIDDDIYGQKFSSPPYKIKEFTDQENKNARRFLLANKKAIRWSFVDGKVCLTDEYCGKKIDFKKPKNKAKSYEDWNADEKNRVRQWITKFKAGILKAGCLCYDDAYFLASVSLQKNSAFKLLLQRRFSCVFVDEMQDMAQHQHDLLESIFFDGGSSRSTYQRIGDKNQSIFDGKEATAQNFWKDRETVLELNGSYRLSSILASIVSPFAIVPSKIEGRRKNIDGSDIAIKPHFIVFSETTKVQVISRFAMIVKTLLDEGKIQANLRNKYKAVAWATQKDDGKLRLCDYYPDYSREEQQQRTDYSTLEGYITNYDKNDRTLSSVERNISNALLRILREEGIVDTTQAQYSKSKMREFLKDFKPNYWVAFEAKLYQWCLGVVQGHGAAALLDIRNNLPEFLLQFEGQINNSSNFINGSSGPAVSASVSLSKRLRNVLPYDGFDVEVSTVHRVKGETHTATLYMETFYQKGAGGNYESERLVNSLKGNTLAVDAHNLVKQSAKMVYVGFSRPTHLLCFAVHECRFAKFGEEIDKDIWEVVRL